jgi:hypothetical protein
VPVALPIGRNPGKLNLALTNGAAFTATLRFQDAGGTSADWPEDTQLRLVLSRDGFARSWPWTFDGELATLTIPADEVTALPLYSLHAQLWLDYGDGEFLWCSGPVNRHA